MTDQISPREEGNQPDPDKTPSYVLVFAWTSIFMIDVGALAALMAGSFVPLLLMVLPGVILAIANAFDNRRYLWEQIGIYFWVTLLLFIFLEFFMPPVSIM